QETTLLHLHLIRTPEPISAIRLGYFRRHLEQISVIVPLSKSMSACMLRLPRLSRRSSRLAHVKNCSAKNQSFYPSAFFLCWPLWNGVVGWDASYRRLKFPKTTEANLNLFGSFGRNADREFQQLLGLSAVAENLRHLFESFRARPAIQTS